MGPWGGMFTGLAESIEYILTPAVIVFFIGSYMTAIFETPAAAQPLVVGGCYVGLPAAQPAWRGAVVPVSVLVTLARACGARASTG